MQAGLDASFDTRNISHKSSLNVCQNAANVMRFDPPNCPKCGSTDFHTTDLFKRHVSVWAWLVGGFFLSVLWSGSRPQKMRCEKCDAVFQQTTHRSRILSVLFLLFIALIIYSWIEEYLEWNK
jgi:hypothetical protein